MIDEGNIPKQSLCVNVVVFTEFGRPPSFRLLRKKSHQDLIFTYKYSASPPVLLNARPVYGTFVSCSSCLQMATVPPFGIILPSRPVLVNPTVISPTQYAFAFPSAPALTHIVAFLLPGNTLPEGTLAGIYVQLPGTAPDFNLLGSIGTDKQSAIFKVSELGSGAADGLKQANGVMEEAMSDVEGPTTAGEVTIGISIEPVATITAQLEALQSSNSSALVASRSQQVPNPLSTKVLAQRIIKNAFNFLASFAGSTGLGGPEVVPLKSFQDWWTKFERRIESDPGFLERDIDN